LASLAPGAGEGDRIVAVVERQVFTEHDLDFWALDLKIRRPSRRDRDLAELHADVVSRAVDSFLLSGWAEKEFEQPLGKEIIDQRLAEAWREREQFAGGRERLLDLLADHGVDQDAYRLWLREYERQQILSRQAIVQYADLKGSSPLVGELADAESILLAHIFFRPQAATPGAALENALRIRRDIEAGLSFAEAARIHSDDEASATVGGELGWFTKDEIDPVLWTAAVGGRRGVVTGPVEARNGLHLLNVVDFETPTQRQWLDKVNAVEDEVLERLRSETEIQLAAGMTMRSLSSPPAEERHEP
jgi:parvulin-like peptidyl-prolyl isomerase